MKRGYLTALFSLMFVCLFLLMGMYWGSVYTGLQSGKPNLQASSVWIQKVSRNDIFDNNLIKLKVCNSGNADVIAKYTVSIKDLDSEKEAIVDGVSLQTGKCRDVSVSFANFNFYNKRNIRLIAVVDNKNKIGELKEDDNNALGNYDLVDLLPNLKMVNVELSKDDFSNKVLRAQVCDSLTNSQNSVTLPFNVEFSINGIKKNVIFDKNVGANNCVSVESPKLKEFGLSKTSKLNVHVSLNEDKKLLERTYIDNTLDITLNV